jgi:hypothetical protein
VTSKRSGSSYTVLSRLAAYVLTRMNVPAGNVYSSIVTSAVTLRTVLHIEGE